MAMIFWQKNKTCQFLWVKQKNSNYMGIEPLVSKVEIGKQLMQDKLRPIKSGKKVVLLP
jgi:hypothetical protein